MIQIHDTTHWPAARLRPYAHDIVHAFDRLARRFPQDVTIEALWKACERGERRLWLILDDEDFVSIALTHVRTIDATGTKIATLSDLAGEGVQDYATELCEALETWARAEGAHIAAVEGRTGWKPLLRKHGYEPFAVLYRKALS